MSPQPYPLSWPAGVPRCERKVASAFKSTLSAALANVKKSLELFAKDSERKVSDIVLSSNVGGLDVGAPQDTGVAAWFMWDGEQRCIAVDRYPKVEDNLQAIHHIIEARRTEMRHGGLHIVRQTFKGFTALPAPDWASRLGIGPGAVVTKDVIEAAYRKQAEKYHPDKPGGSNDRMAEINEARRYALSMLPR